MNTTNTPDLSDAFFTKWVAMSDRLRLNPMHLMRVAMAESGVRASAHNLAGDASGLIQFMPATLKNLGWLGSHTDFRTASAEEQVPWVEAYMKVKADRCHTDALCYVAVFLPGLLDSAVAGGLPFVLCGNGKLQWAYDANRVFDTTKKGCITVQDLSNAISRACRGLRWLEIEARLTKAMAAAEPAQEPTKAPVLTTIQYQTLLSQRGFNPGPLDGVRGPLTIAAVRAFQKRMALIPDGIVGPLTTRRLMEAIWVAP